MKKINTIIVLSLLTLSFGCKKQAATATATSTSSPYITVAQLSGIADGPCKIVVGNSLGTNFAGSSYLTSFSSNASGTYSLDVAFYTGTVCQFGGTPMFSFSQSGVISPQGAATSPSGATQLIFTVTANYVTPYSAGWATNLNNACGIGAIFSNGATHNVTGMNCASTSAANGIINFSATNAALYNVATLSGKAFSIGIPTSVWEIGNGGYPASTGLNFTYR
ncbi:MAG: hypothetical protein H7336_12105 [Bacteriovorax sp.]|nr:hypothetical protein [Bacteriovorax sp.]